MFIALALSVGCVSSGLAAVDTYQVTGPILALTDSTIVVEKNHERWEIARDDKTKAPSTVKVGDKVTVHYRMVATTVETKGDGTANKTHPVDRAPAATTPAKAK